MTNLQPSHGQKKEKRETCNPQVEQTNNSLCGNYEFSSCRIIIDGIKEICG